ncbi:MAG: response regulator [Candidatus Promineifilaceae bacterium]
MLPPEAGDARPSSPTENKAKPIRILLVDSHARVRAGVRALVGAEPDMMVVGDAADAETALIQARALQPDIIVLDLALPDLGGLAVVRAFRLQEPQARILILTNNVDEEQILAVMLARVAGYLLKGSRSPRIEEAIRSAYQGGIVLNPLVTQILLKSLKQNIEGKGVAS